MHLDPFSTMHTIPQRQVHLDFHNSPFIPGICANYDAAKLARTMAESHVESVTVFARCIHGMAYYPTRIGQTHPHLDGRDFLGETIEALHDEGIRAPIYVTITWEEGVAAAHPEWRQMTADGRFATMNTDMAATPVPGSQWKLLDFIHPDYMDYIESYLAEIMDRYPCDGFFLDMVFYAPDAGWSEAARAFRQANGITGTDAAAHVAFETLAQKHFCQRITRFIQAKKPGSSIFYNTPNNLYTSRKTGASARWDFQTHVEVESLPSGIWGYEHFPKIGRRLSGTDQPWLGMTGRFQKMWGDFGGLKPRAALEYECFRTQALGGANSVGDQLLPDGHLDTEAYSLIGKVFSQCREAEDFYADSTSAASVAILCPNHPGLDSSLTGHSEEGAVRLLHELRYECVVVDDEIDLDRFSLLVLPDEAFLHDDLIEKIKEFLARGGKVLASHRAGIEGSALTFVPDLLNVHGETTLFPNYWRSNESGPLAGLSSENRVFYSRGLDVKAPQAEIWMRRVEPFFQRDDLHYCSHFQTPPSDRDSPYPAVLRKNNLLYFADPLFREYRETGNGFVKRTLSKALEVFLGPPPVSGLRPTIETYLRRREKDLLLTLLHYIPTRKSVQVDVIETSQSFLGEILTFDKPVREVVDSRTGRSLEKRDEHSFILREGEGCLLLKIPDYFAQ